MSRRTLAEAGKALMIRRLQQEAALLRLRAQQRVSLAAGEELDRSVERHLASEQAWTDALNDTVDADVVGLWRAHTEDRLGDVRTARLAWEEETASEARFGAAWARQVRLAEAVQDVVRAAGRKARRADEERRLGAAEDARMARGMRS